MNTEVTKTTGTKLPTTMPTGAWGTENIKTDNILIPQVYLMQGQSRGVQDEKAKVGEIVDSVEYKVIGDSKKAFKFIPLCSFDTFMVQTKEGDRWQYLRTDLVTPQNQHHMKFENWESTEKVKDPKTGVLVEKRLKWTYELKFYVLPSDGFKTALPHVLGFRSTSIKAGRALTNHFVRCRQDNLPPATYVMEATSNKVTKNGNTYFVYEISLGTKSTTEQLETAWKWYSMIQGGKTEVHAGSEDTQETAPQLDEDMDV